VCSCRRRGGEERKERRVERERRGQERRGEKRRGERGE
jgi:hypothetical protein